MRIIMFAEHYPNPYKPYLDSELSFLLRKGNDVVVYAAGAFRETVQPRFRQEGLDRVVRHYPSTLSSAYRFLPGVGLRFMRRPFLCLRRSGVAITATPLASQVISSVMRASLLSDDPPDILYFHDLASIRWMKIAPLVFPHAGRVLHFHGGVPHGGREVADPAATFTSMDLVLTNTDASVRQAVAMGCPPDLLAVRPMGLDLEDYPRQASKQYFPEDRLRIVSVGRLSQEKGIQVALRALHLMLSEGATDITYQIIGVGTAMQALKELSHELGLSSVVRFRGELSKPEVVKIMRESDVLVLPSLNTPSWAETQALVVQEAMMMQLLVVTTEAGGVPESIPEEMRQFAVPPGEPEALKHALERVRQLSRGEAVQLGEIARDWTRTRYDIEVSGSLLLDRIRQLHRVGRSPTPRPAQ